MHEEVKQSCADIEAAASGSSAADTGTRGFFDGKIIAFLREWLKQGGSVKDFWTFLPILLDLLLTYGPMIADIVKKIIDRLKGGATPAVLHADIASGALSF